MKTIVKGEELVLQVQTTGDTTKDIGLPLQHLHYWYPFNINFTYRYSNSKRFMYLVKERDYTGENLYHVDILKKTKPLGHRDGIMFHPYVYKRNRYIIDKAHSLGLPVINRVFTKDIVDQGFMKLRELISVIKEPIIDRFMENDDNAWYTPDSPTDEWDAAVYEHATAAELEVLQEFGEMYTMLTLMRKVIERR